MVSFPDHIGDGKLLLADWLTGWQIVPGWESSRSNFAAGRAAVKWSECWYVVSVVLVFTS